MANEIPGSIWQDLQQISTAVYGREVRKAIHDSIEWCVNACANPEMWDAWKTSTETDLDEWKSSFESMQNWTNPWKTIFHKDGVEEQFKDGRKHIVTFPAKQIVEQYFSENGTLLFTVTHNIDKDVITRTSDQVTS